MAELLKPGGISTCFWPVDKLMLAYFAITTAIVLWWWSALAEAPRLLVLHVIAVGLLTAGCQTYEQKNKVIHYWRAGDVDVSPCDLAAGLPGRHRGLNLRFLPDAR